MKKQGTQKTMHGRRGMTFRRLVMSAAVVGALGVMGLGGYVYYRNNSTTQLAARANIALEQHDSVRAQEYIARALRRHSTGETGMGLKVLMARALIEQDQDREPEAREYLKQVLAEKPDHLDALDLLARSYVTPTYGMLRRSFKPVSETAAQELYQSIEKGLEGLAALPASGRNLVAQAELHHLYYLLLVDQSNQANAQESATELEDAATATNRGAGATQRAQAKSQAADHRDKAIGVLQAALKTEPGNTAASGLLADYFYQEKQFDQAIAVYGDLKKLNAVSEDLALTTARALIADEARQADKVKRLADAQQVLDAYLADHPHSVRIMVSLGDVLLDQDRVAAAVAIGERAAAESGGSNGGAGELYAQILLVNCRMREKKIDDALKLISPMTTTFANRPEVWYLQGTAQTEAGDLVAAENAFKKALAVSAQYAPAREALLALQIRMGNTEGAALTASQVLRENRYEMTAWDVTIDGLRKRGQIDRARDLLVALAQDAEVPVDARPELIRLLATYGAPGDARRLLAALPENDPATLKLRAMVAASGGGSGGAAEARGLFAQAVAASPEDVDLRLKYIDSLMQGGLNADVRAQLEALAAPGAGTGAKAASVKPLTADQTLTVARDYLQIRLPAQAAAAVKPLADKQPQNLEARTVLQQAQAMLAAGGGGATAPAAGAVAAPVDLTLASVGDIVGLATDSLGRKKFQEALGQARAGLNKDHANAALHLIAARSLAGLQQIDQAVDEAIEAAKTEPNRVEAFATFVALFPTPDAAMQGFGYGSRLEPVNAAFGNWAMGQLAEVSGQYDLALRYYQKGIDISNAQIDSHPSKDQLYQGMIHAQVAKKDAAGLRKTADTLAGTDPVFAAGIRLMAADQLLALGDREGAAQQLEKLTGAHAKGAPAKLVLAIAGRWQSLGQADRARTLLEKEVAASPHEPELLNAYATLLMQAKDVDKAIEQLQQLVKLDAGNPEYRVTLARAQAAGGDYPQAFATLAAAESTGATGKQMAGGERVRMLISLGLLNEATAALEAKGAATPAADDFASLLAVAQAWSQLEKFDEARKAAAAIPGYAGEFGPARLLLAAIDLQENHPQAAVDSLNALLQQAPAGRAQIAPQLFLAHLRAGNAAAALELATHERAGAPAGAAAWKTWTTLAATAAREGRQYDQGIALLNSLDADGRKAAALDIALLNLLSGKSAEASSAAAALPDDAPLFNRSTIGALAGKPADAGLRARILAGGLPSAVLSALASVPADEQAAALKTVQGNRNLLSGDIETLLKQPGIDGAKLRSIALAERLQEAGWSTSALDVLAAVDKNNTVDFIAVLRHQALMELHRTAEADAVRDALAARVKDGLAPAARILLAGSWSREQKFAEALHVLEPLAPLNRPEVLTTLATLHEKLGEFDAAIALHRQVRTLDPNNLAAANNVAYLLATAHGADRAALAEASSAIHMAIEKAPEITAFQDTLGWIEILSGNAAEGTRRIAAAAPALRLDPAVHYHLGIGYLKLGQNELARMHLMDVEALAKDRKNVPELQQATDALRTIAAAP